MRTAVLVALVVAAGAVVAELGSAGRAGGERSAAPTYFQQVKPVLDARCGNCHMAGGLAPFSLKTYGQARRNRTAISAAVRTRLMPPWHADRGYRNYLWNPSLSKSQISTIVRWATAGAPKGDPASPALRCLRRTAG